MATPRMHFPSRVEIERYLAHQSLIHEAVKKESIERRIVDLVAGFFADADKDKEEIDLGVLALACHLVCQIFLHPESEEDGLAAEVLLSLRTKLSRVLEGVAQDKRPLPPSESNELTPARLGKYCIVFKGHLPSSLGRF